MSPTIQGEEGGQSMAGTSQDLGTAVSGLSELGEDLKVYVTGHR